MNAEWVIQSRSEGEDGEPAYWSNQCGWMLGMESATSFDGSQGFPGDRHRLPMSRDMDAEWISLRDAESFWAGDVIISLSPEDTRKCTLIEVLPLADRGQVSVDAERPQWFEVRANLVNGTSRTVAMVREESTASSIAKRLSAETRVPIQDQHTAMAA